MKKIIQAFTAGSVLLACATACSAFEGILTYSTSVVGFVTGTGGWNFVPLQNISVTSLGCFDNVLTGQPSISVGLWDQNGSLLSSTSITSADPLVNLSRYESVTPVTLLAGQTYFLGAYSPLGTITFAAESPALGGFAITSPQIQLGTDVVSTNGFSFPSIIDGPPSGTAILAPNFQFVVVPEPSIAALTFLSGSAVVWRRLRKRKNFSCL